MWPGLNARQSFGVWIRMKRSEKYTSGHTNNSLPIHGERV
jgi:hypothetical protein